MIAVKVLNLKICLKVKHTERIYCGLIVHVFLLLGVQINGNPNTRYMDNNSWSNPALSMSRKV